MVESIFDQQGGQRIVMENLDLALATLTLIAMCTGLAAGMLRDNSPFHQRDTYHVCYITSNFVAFMGSLALCIHTLFL